MYVDETQAMSVAFFFFWQTHTVGAITFEFYVVFRELWLTPE